MSQNKSFKITNQFYSPQKSENNINILNNNKSNQQGIIKQFTFSKSKSKEEGNINNSNNRNNPSNQSANFLSKSVPIIQKDSKSNFRTISSSFSQSQNKSNLFHSEAFNYFIADDDFQYQLQKQKQQNSDSESSFDNLNNFENVQNRNHSISIKKSQKIKQNDTDSCSDIHAEGDIQKKKKRISKNKKKINEDDIHLKMEWEAGKPHEIIFRWKIYLQFYIIYMLFFMILGPILLIILRYIYKSMNFARNLKLWGNNRYTYITHFIFYMNLCLQILIYKSETIESLSKIAQQYFSLRFEFVFYTSLFLIQFGFIHPIYLYEMKKKIMPEKQLSQLCHFYQIWLHQSNETIEKELKNANTRLEVENSLFYLEFTEEYKQNQEINPKDNHYKKYLPLYKKLPKLINKSKKYNNIIKGYDLAKEIIQKFQVEKQNNKFIRNSLIVATLKIIIFFIMVFYILKNDIEEYQFKYDELSASQKVYLFLITITQSFFIFSNCFYLLYICQLYKHDLQRKKYFMTQMGFMVAHKKHENHVKSVLEQKLFPSINILCPVTVKSWETLRKLLLEYGKMQEKVLGYIMSLYLFSYIIIRFLIYISELIFPNSNFFATISTKLLPAFDMVFLYHSIISTLSLGSQINESFGQHRLKIFRNHLIIEDILRNFSFYKQNLQILVNPSYREITKSIQIIKNLFSQVENNNKSNNQQQLETNQNFLEQKYFQTIKNTCQIQLNELDLSYRHQQYKVLGIGMTRLFATKMALAIISIIFALILQILYNPNK